MHLDPIRALQIIVGMVHEDCDNGLLGDIYMVAHQAAKPDCAKNHPDFCKRALEIEKELVEANIIAPWKESI